MCIKCYCYLEISKSLNLYISNSSKKYIQLCLIFEFIAYSVYRNYRYICM